MDHAFVDFDQSNPNCVVLGDATDRFSYENVNRAFQLLVENRETKLITLGTGLVENQLSKIVLKLLKE